MANANRPSGMSPVSYLTGAPWNGMARQYYVSSGDTTVIALGDPVKSSGSADSNGVAGVTLGTAGTAMRGIVVGIAGTKMGAGLYDPDNLTLRVLPATKTKSYYVLVADDPNIIFEVQEIGTGTQLTADEVGLNCNLVAGTNNGYVSGWLLTNTTEATTAALDVKLLQLAPRIDNAFGAYAKWWVQLNNHELKAAVAGV